MKTKPGIILIGGGGHCKAVIDVIETENKYRIVGIVDVPEKLGQDILGYKIIGNDNHISKFAKQYKCFCITVGHMKSSTLRIKLFNIVKDAGGELPVIISANAHVSKHSIIGEGTVVMLHVVINADAEIGKNCIINNKALIEHDCKIGNNCHISTNSTINGTCKIGDNCFVGSSSVIRNNMSIISDTIIGAGAVVTKNITERGIYVGNPARKIK